MSSVLADGQRWRRWLGWTCYLLAVFVLIEVSLQGFYRATTGAWYWDSTPSLYVGNEISGYTNKANLSFHHVTPEFAVDIFTNSQGFRVSRAHEEYRLDGASDTMRVLLLGPSFAYGWGVNYERTFGEQLRQRLATARFGGYSSVEILNHGVPGLPTANSLEWFRYKGRAYSPQIVILFVYGSLDESEEPAPSPLITKVKTVWSYAKLSTTIYYTGVLIGIAHRSWHGVGEGDPIEGAGRAMTNRTAFNTDDPRVKESVRLYTRFKDEVHQAGARLLIVHFPLPYVVHPEDLSRWVLHGVTNVTQQIQFNQEFCSYLVRQGIECVNLTNQLMEAAKHSTERLYYWLDIHWTERGNAIVAQMVSDYVMKTEIAQIH
jgi:hypothetical protein